MADHQTQPQPTSWRIKIGTAMFAIPFLMFFGAPVVVPFIVTSAADAAAIIGAIIVAAEVIWFLSIPLLGLKGFKALKSQAFGKLALPEGPISPARNRFGFRLFVFGFLLQQLVLLWLLVGSLMTADEDLGAGLLGMTLLQEALVLNVTILVSVVAMVASLYVMGMPFFHRLRADAEAGEPGQGG